MAKKPKKSRVITKKVFDSWSADKQQRALNDRRTRIRIEDKALPKDWLDRRNTARRNRTPITEGSGTTYGDLEKQRAYLEPLTFGEGDRQLADRTQNLAAARQRDADWFNQYRQQVSDAQQRAIGAQQQAVTGNQQLIQSATDASNASRDSIVQQLQARAAQLGQTSQAPEYQGLADAATAARNAQMVNTGQRQLANAALDVGSATSGVTVAGLKDLEARGFRDRQSGALDKDRADYGSKKDQWRAKFIDDAIAEARKQVLEDRAFGATQADRAADNKRADDALRERQKSNRANRQIARDRLRESQRAARERERLAAQREARQGQPKSNAKPATPKETRDVAQKIRNAVNLVRYMRQQGKDKNGVKYTTSSIRAVLAKKGTDADVVNSAMDIVYLGGIGRVNRSRWRRAGYNPRDFNQPFQKGR